jgi:NitT/TauT family transport system substrate-binding protein
MRAFRTAAVLTLACALAAPAGAATKLSFLTSWKAQAEHGGYYMAVANGYYTKCGDDVTIRQGGPAMDAKQLFAAGAVDLMMAPYTDDALTLVSVGAKSRAVAAFFQKSPQILMTHAGNGINKMEDMLGKPIMISAGLRATVWPWLKATYGFTDAQMRNYTGQLAPWLVDPQAIQQGIITNEPNLARKAGQDPKSFLLADLGYGSYSSMVVASQALIDRNPAAVQCFVDASIDGWKAFFKDPAPAVKLIKADNPDNSDDTINYAIETMKSAHLVEDAATDKLGIGAMSDARWQSHFEMLVAAGVLPKDMDYRNAYTLQFVNKRHSM